MPISGLSAAGRGTEVDRRTLDLVATVIERCEGPGEPGPGHPPAETVRVLATLRRLLRECTSRPSLACTTAAGRAAWAWESGAGRWSAATPGCWRTNVSPCATTGSASSSSRCSRPAVSAWLQAASFANCDNRLLVVQPLNCCQ